MCKSFDNKLDYLQQSDDDYDEPISSDDEILSDDDNDIDLIWRDLVHFGRDLIKATTITVRKGGQGKEEEVPPVPVPAAQDDGNGIRQIEKLVRNIEMHKLYAYIKGTRSKPDHVDEALSYIKRKQETVNELSIQRDKLKQEEALSYIKRKQETVNELSIQRDKLKQEFSLNENVSSSTGSSSINSRVIPNTVRVTLGQGGLVEILINGDEKVPLTEVFAALLQQGLTKIDQFFSINVNDRFLHTIKSQGSGEIFIDPSRLQEELNGVVNMTT